MLRSMTGYGRGEVSGNRHHCVVEARSVNHRFLDTSIKLPKRLAFLENDIRQAVHKRFSRGRFDISVSWQVTEEGEKVLRIDRDLARQYLTALQELEQEFGLVGPVKAEVLASFRELFQLVDREEDLEAVSTLLSQALDAALDALEGMRSVEGQALREDVGGRVQRIGAHARGIKARYPLVLAEQHERLKERVQSLVGDLEIDPQRLAQEIAFLADKSDISEELTRLESHLSQLLFHLEEETPVGRTLEFLLQEVHREVNTLGVKANDVLVSQAVVAIKAELEKIREQVQNIE